MPYQFTDRKVHGSEEVSCKHFNHTVPISAQWTNSVKPMISDRNLVPGLNGRAGTPAWFISEYLCDVRKLITSKLLHAWDAKLLWRQCRNPQRAKGHCVHREGGVDRF